MRKWIVLLLLSAPVAAQSGPKAARRVNLMTAPVKWPTIRAGDDDAMGGFNTRVAAIQYLLRFRKFYRGKVDGVFGAKTVAALKAFQKSRALKVDGVAGPQTLPKLVVPLKRGAKGDAVRAAQILARGASDHVAAMPNLGLSVDGNFGKETETAVANAQFSVRGMEGLYLRDNGVMDARSWCLMLGGTVVGEDS